jgi:N-acetylmuramic acid 6-phosphate etherase
MVLTGLDSTQAKAALASNKGFLRKAVEQQGC